MYNLWITAQSHQLSHFRQIIMERVVQDQNKGSAFCLLETAPILSVGRVVYCSSVLVKLMELSRNTRHNPWTKGVLFIECKTGPFFLISCNLIRNIDLPPFACTQGQKFVKLKGEGCKSSEETSRPNSCTSKILPEISSSCLYKLNIIKLVYN